MQALSPFPMLDIGASSNRLRSTSRPVLLVGFQHQGNLGLGYLAAVLKQHGYRVIVYDVEAEPAAILREAQAAAPVLMDFSLIFQFYVHRFGSLVRYLREHGIACHFTMGGHFPSLSSQHTLALIPDLDSVVRFEGELTLLELADVLSIGRDWRGIEGIAYRQGTEVVTTPLRTLLHDLDQLPYPDRAFQPESILGHHAMPLLASRGCARTCSFCSIHTFYRAAPGKVVRTRQPERVADEMHMLHEEHGITIFLFQDDDFPLFGPAWRRWTLQFLEALHRKGLPGQTLWKINCRADAVEPELFAAMREAGLYLVYMGLESGSEDGLATLHKQITVEQNLHAVAVLKELRLMFEFGFMMFDPSTTFASIHDNVDFLQAITGDGSAAAVFCRMLPYDGTPIKTTIEQSGRLRGDVCNPDYDFLDARLAGLYDEVNHLIHVTGWIHGYRALSPQLNWAWNEVAVMERLFPPLAGMAGYKHELRTITQASNTLLFQVVRDLCVAHEAGESSPWIATDLERRWQVFLERLMRTRNNFVRHNQEIMLQALGYEAAGAASRG